jgi:hypothetical protein
MRLKMLGDSREECQGVAMAEVGPMLSEEQEASHSRGNRKRRRAGKGPSCTKRMYPIKEDHEGEWPVGYVHGLEADGQKVEPVIASKMNEQSQRPA